MYLQKSSVPNTLSFSENLIHTHDKQCTCVCLTMRNFKIHNISHDITKHLSSIITQHTYVFSPLVDPSVFLPFFPPLSTLMMCAGRTNDIWLTLKNFSSTHKHRGKPGQRIRGTRNSLICVQLFEKNHLTCPLNT